MRYFPLFIDLEERRAVVVGGGEEALRKIRLLLKTNARIEVIASALPAELVGNGKVVLITAPYHRDLITGATIVLSADSTLNPQVSADAQALGILVNAVDDAAISTFIVPSIVDRDPVVIAIGTEGTAPVLGQSIRARIDTLLPQGLGHLARRAAALRDFVAARVPHGTTRRAFWADFFSGKDNLAIEMDDEVAQKLALDDAIYAFGKAKAGRVSVVGVGADPELLTLKAHRRLMEADLIVHDHHIPPQILEMARRDATRIDVGKFDQSEINAILAAEANAGREVVRLKANSTQTAGRSVDEMTFVTAQGIAVEVVPGVAEQSGRADILPFPSRDDARETNLRAVS